MNGPPPVRLRLSRAEGFRLQAHSYAVNGLPAINVARPFALGNPWVCLGPFGCPHSPRYDHGHEEDGTPSMHCCVDVYAEWLRQGLAGEESRLVGIGGGLRAGLMAEAGNKERTKAVAALSRARGCNVACWCVADAARCHGDVVLRLANLTCAPMESPDGR